jgi:hypothetical protein
MARKTISTIVLAAVALLLAGGCGGSGGGGGQNGGGDTSGAFQGAVDMPNNTHGIVTLEVEEDGAAQGRFLVFGPPNAGPAPAADGFPPGFYAIYGNASNGAMDLQGVAGSTPFTVTGQLPDGDGEGTISFHVEGSDFSGTIAKDTSPPAAGELAYSAVTESNAHTATFPASEISVTFGGGDGYLDVFFNDTTGTTGRSISFNIPSDVEVGDVLTCTELSHIVSYNEHLPGTFLPNVWAANSGTVTITARSGSHIAFTLTNVHMEHVTSFGEATGSFVLNGSIHS